MMTLNNPLDPLRAARTHCTDHCFSHHAAWRLMRRAGLKSNPTWHTGFYRTALKEWQAPQDVLRVLLVGAADETMLNVLARLLDPARMDIRLIDACPTPLDLASAYAYWTGLHLTVAQDRAPELATCQGEFDLIITDGLLSSLPGPEERTATVRRLAQLLAPDGLLLYTARIAGTAGVLEYERLGRHLMAATALTAWPGPARERLRLANALRTRPSHPDPFTTGKEVAALIADHFSTVRTHTRYTPHSWPLALAPSVRAGHGSISVGVAAAHPHPRSRS